MMAFQIFACASSSCHATFYTLDELANHRLEAHERPVDEGAARLRLAFEDNRVGRVRTTPAQGVLTHWHRLRIAGRPVDLENGGREHANG